ncbi:MAG: hypothetical protein ACYSWW_28755 [Planctomycetota bacterium]|jgi:hypothetical protein
MRLTEFERDVLIEFIRSNGIETDKLGESLDKIEVLARDFTGTGFTIELKRNPCLRIGSPDMSYKGGDVVVHLNEDKIDVGFLFYIEEGHIDGFEGYTFGEYWPSKIVCYDIGQSRAK